MRKAPLQQLGLGARRNVRHASTIFKCGSCDVRIHTLHGVTDFPFAAPYRIKFHRSFNLVVETNDDLICYNFQRKLGWKFEYGFVSYAELYDVIAASDDSDDDDDD